MQILQSGPSEFTLRQRAFRNDLNQGLQAGANLFEGIREQEQLTLRQKALDEQRNLENLQLSQSLGVTPEQVQAFRETGATTEMGVDDMGPPAPNAIGKALALMGQQRQASFDQKKLEQARNLRRQKMEDERLGLTNEKLRADIQQLNNPTIGNQGEIRKVGVAGFEVADPKYVPTKEDQTKLKNTMEATRNIMDTAQKLTDALESAGGPTSGLGLTQADRNVGQFQTALQLQMKELFNLGVLNGPDLDLLNDALGRLRGPVDQFTVSKSEAISQINNVINDAVNRSRISAETRGYKPTSGNVVFNQKPIEVRGSNTQLLGNNDSFNGGYDPSRPLMENVIPSATANQGVDFKAVETPLLQKRLQELKAKSGGR